LRGGYPIRKEGKKKEGRKSLSEHPKTKLGNCKRGEREKKASL